MKKIIFAVSVFMLLNSFVFAIEDNIDKDDMHNLIDGVTSFRAGIDRVSFIYDFAPLANNYHTPFKLGVAILDLTQIVNNTNISPIDGKRYLSFLPKAFIGMSYGDFGLGYQFNIIKNIEKNNNRDDIAQSHSLSFAFSMTKYRFVLPVSVALGNKEVYTGNTSLSLTPKFSFLFRAGWLDEFSISVHYGVQFSSSTNDQRYSTPPMVIGGSLYGKLMFTRFDSAPVQISSPIEIAFYYGFKSRWADIDAGYANDVERNYMYGDDGKISSDSMKALVILPLKIEAKIGAIYVYGMPRLIFGGEMYKTTFVFNLHYGIEGEAQFTPVENFTFGVTAYGEGKTITRKQADIRLTQGFGAGVDIWGIWRF